MFTKRTTAGPINSVSPGAVLAWPWSGSCWLRLALRRLPDRLAGVVAATMLSRPTAKLNIGHPAVSEGAGASVTWPRIPRLLPRRMLRSAQ